VASVRLLPLRTRLNSSTILAISPKVAGARAIMGGNGRDIRIDFFRGLALLCIFVDHIPGNVLARLTLCNFGFSDAAEVFVLLAGISAAAAYYNKVNNTRKILKRAATIYGVQVLLVLVVPVIMLCASWLTGRTEFLAGEAALVLTSGTASMFVQIVTLNHQPDYINILPLYVVLLCSLPVFFWVHQIDRRLPLAMSFAVWCVANAFQINLQKPGGAEWFFNPLAWQFIFFAGVTIGMNSGRALDFKEMPRSRSIFVGAALFLLFAFIVSAPWAQVPVAVIREFRVLPPDILGLINKSYASGWRIVHVACLAYVSMWLIRRNSTWLRHPAAEQVRNVGSVPLFVFACASLLSYSANIVLDLIGRGIVSQLAVNALGLTVLLAVARPRSISGGGFGRRASAILSV
jgi:hypothetical protein